MGKLINKIHSNHILKGVLTLGIGTVMGQAISVLSQPILTRLCSPETLGIYSIILSLGSVVIPIASLKLEYLIVTEKDDTEADKITQTCYRLLFIVTLLFIIYSSIMYFSGNPTFTSLGASILLLPILIITHGLRIIFQNYNNRFREYKIVAKLVVWRSLISMLIQVGSAILGGGAVGQTLGYAISPLYGMKRQTSRYRKQLKHRIKLTTRESIQIVRANLSHIVNLVPAEFVNTFAFVAITLTVLDLYGTAIVGYYTLSFRVLMVPLAMISVNVSQVLLRTITSEIQEKRSSYECCVKTMKGLSLISVAAFTTLFFIAPYACEIVFGKGWGQAGVYISILSPMYAAKFVATSLISVYTVAKKQRNQLIIQGAFLLASGLLYLFANILMWNVEVYLFITSIVYTVLYAVMLIDIVSVCKRLDLSNVKQG